MAQLRAVEPKKQRAPRAPRALAGRAAAIYRDLEPAMRLSGRLTDESLPLFRLWCQTMAVAEAAGRKLQASEDPVEARGRKDARVADPAWRGFRDATALALQLGREFGLTPAAALSMRTAQTPDEQAAKLLA